MRKLLILSTAAFLASCAHAQYVPITGLTVECPNETLNYKNPNGVPHYLMVRRFRCDEKGHLDWNDEKKSRGRS